jgi:hypothetical protein
MEQKNPEEEILAQAKIDFDYWSNGDTLGYGKSAADDITFFNNTPATARIDGIQAYSTLLSSWEGLIPPHKYKIVDPMIQVYDNVGIYTLHYHAISEDGQVLVRARATLVYRNIDDSWKMVHSHFSNFEEA